MVKKRQNTGTQIVATIFVYGVLAIIAGAITGGIGAVVFIIIGGYAIGKIETPKKSKRNAK